MYRDNNSDHLSNDPCLIRPRHNKRRSIPYNRTSQNFRVRLHAFNSAETQTASFVPLAPLPSIESFDKSPVVFSMLPPVSTFFDLTAEPFERRPTSIFPRRACSGYIPSSSELFRPGQEQEINDLFKRSFKSIYDTY
jgi:hypothetical protein